MTYLLSPDCDVSSNSDGTISLSTCLGDVNSLRLANIYHRPQCAYVIFVHGDALVGMSPNAISIYAVLTWSIC